MTTWHYFLRRFFFFFFSLLQQLKLCHTFSHSGLNLFSIISVLGDGWLCSCMKSNICVSGFPSGVSVTSSNTGVPDISGSVYTKTQVSADPKSLNRIRVWDTILFSLFVLCSLCVVLWETGLPHGSSTRRLVQCAVSTGQWRPHQPPGCSALCSCALHAHPHSSAAPLTDAAPPPAAGRPGQLQYTSPGLNNCIT